MTILEHSLLALGVCLAAVVVLFHPRAKLHEPDEHAENPGSEAGRSVEYERI